VKAAASEAVTALCHKMRDNVMSILVEHLSQERLSRKEMDSLTELMVLLKAIDFKPERSNPYRYDNEPGLFDIVQRLIKELDI
jgi:hypothetical protein